MKLIPSYIAVEGVDCSGKDTLVDRFKALFPEACYVHEISGTPLADAHRQRLLTDDQLTLDEQLTLLTEARIDILKTHVVPALAEGRTVISNRSFLSTVVYQYLLHNPNIRLPESEMWRTFLAFYRRVKAPLAEAGLPLPTARILLTVPMKVLLKRLEHHEDDAIVRRANPLQIQALYESLWAAQLGKVQWVTLLGHRPWDTHQLPMLLSSGIFAAKSSIE